MLSSHRERDTFAPAHAPAVAGGTAFCAPRAGQMRARSRPCRSCGGAPCASQAGHAHARSRPRRCRRGCALRNLSGTHACPLTSPPLPAGSRSAHSERDRCVPAHVPAVASGDALFASRAGHMCARSRPRRSRRGTRFPHHERDTCVPAHVPAVTGWDGLCASRAEHMRVRSRPSRSRQGRSLRISEPDTCRDIRVRSRPRRSRRGCILRTASGTHACPLTCPP